MKFKTRPCNHFFFLLSGPKAKQCNQKLMEFTELQEHVGFWTKMTVNSYNLDPKKINTKVETLYLPRLQKII